MEYKEVFYCDKCTTSGPCLLIVPHDLMPEYDLQFCIAEDTCKGNGRNAKWKPLDQIPGDDEGITTMNQIWECTFCMSPCVVITSQWLDNAAACQLYGCMMGGRSNWKLIK